MKESKASDVLKLVSFADLTPEQKSKAESLVTLYKGSKAAQTKISELKNELLPAIKDNDTPIEIDGYVLVYVNGSEVLVLNRDKLKAKIMNDFKLSEMAAEAWITQICTKKENNSTLKLMARASLDKISQTLKDARMRRQEASGTIPPPAVNPAPAPVVQAPPAPSTNPVA